MGLKTEIHNIIYPYLSLLEASLVPIKTTRIAAYAAVAAKISFPAVDPTYTANLKAKRIVAIEHVTKATVLPGYRLQIHDEYWGHENYSTN